ncbi:MAG: hypothetical protein WAW59_00145 [Patescibacteria group bacterium]
MSASYIIIKRHGILLLLMTARYFFYLIPIGVILWFYYAYRGFFSSDVVHFVLLPALLLGINYIFIRVIISIIDFYGRFILLGGTTIILIHTTILLKDDIEFMNIQSVLKVDVERHGFFANILNYGHLILEQRNEIRKVHYVPSPHKLCQIINERIPRENKNIIIK